MQIPIAKKDYADNDVRFIFFCRGVLETLKRLGWQPDIIHCNDWQTGLIPAYIKTIYSDDPFFKHIKTVFTIHNLAYQGTFPASSFEKTGLPESEFQQEGVEFYGKLNFMKSGLVYSDVITTVSEKYAEEICSSEEFGCGLEGVLQKKKSHLHGITNGIDYTIWNPETDEHIVKRYDVRTLEGKLENKKELLSKFGLAFKENVPLIGIISRLVDQKGLDLIKEIADDLMKLDIQFVMLAAGEKRYQEYFESMHKKLRVEDGDLHRLQRRTCASHRSRLRYVPHAVPVRAVRAQSTLQLEIRNCPHRPGHRRIGGYDTGFRRKQRNGV